MLGFVFPNRAGVWRLNPEVNSVDMEKETMHLIEIKELRKAFGPIVAVDGISFTVDKGDVLGFIESLRAEIVEA